MSFTLHLDELIRTIENNVSQMVKEHLQKQFQLIITSLCTQYQLSEPEVVQYLQEAKLLDVAGPSSVPPNTGKSTGKRKIVDPEPKCTGFTKAGNPCRYRVVSGMDVCKKHNVKNQAQMATKVPKVTDLPTDEQAWFEKQNEYQRSFYPQYEKSALELDMDIMDDTVQPAQLQQFVTDE